MGYFGDTEGEYRDLGLSGDYYLEGHSQEELEESKPLQIADELLFGGDTAISDQAISKYNPDTANSN